MKWLPPLAVTIGLLASVVASVAAPRAKDEKDDLKKLEGNWVATGWTQGGQALPGEVLESIKWSVKGDKYTFEMGDSTEEGSVKIDHAKKPATIDLAITSGADKGKDQVGIYKIDGDTVTFCFARPGAKDRPTEFSSTEDNGHILLTVKRFKKDD
jgi:uncharacterized protein (TIGR03067 family)